MERERDIAAIERRQPGTGEPPGGHFRILFTGYRAQPAAPAAVGSRRAEAAAYGSDAWGTPEDEDEKAYFQADISWINLAGSDTLQTSVSTAMITGDVRGMRKRMPEDAAAPGKTAECLPLSLGTYALVSGVNAVSIANPTLVRVAALRSYLVDPPLRKATRSRLIFLTCESAGALANTDQGLGRGIFPIECKEDGSGSACTLYFGIDRV